MWYISIRSSADERAHISASVQRSSTLAIPIRGWVCSMSRVVKRSALRPTSPVRRAGASPSALHSSPAFPVGREASGWASMAARNKTGRVSHARTHRPRPRAARNSNRARLDRQISKGHRGAREPEREDCRSRRRTLRRRRRRIAELCADGCSQIMSSQIPTELPSSTS